MAVCVICKGGFPAKRIDAQCCSANCRNKLARLRRNQDKLAKAWSWDMYQHKDMAAIRELSQEAANHIETIRAQAGSDMGEHAIQAARLLLEAYRKSVLA